MGTSAARRGPRTGRWRLAKAAATRYLSPDAGGPAYAAEVIRRYGAALAETAGPDAPGALAQFRLTRQVAQEVGALAATAAAAGWPAALEGLELGHLAGQPPEVVGQGLAAALVGPAGGLEAAALRPALALWLPRQFADKPSPAPPLSPPTGVPADSVRWFLILAGHLRLVLDLGESLEAAAASAGHLQQGLAGLHEAMARRAGAGSIDDAPPATPEHWRGLPGWTWITRTLSRLLA
jgi:hypothetical protein